MKYHGIASVLTALFLLCCYMLPLAVQWLLLGFVLLQIRLGHGQINTDIRLVQKKNPLLLGRGIGDEVGSDHDL